MKVQPSAFAVALTDELANQSMTIRLASGWLKHEIAWATAPQIPEAERHPQISNRRRTEITKL
jgi:hypothetical protein